MPKSICFTSIDVEHDLRKDPREFQGLENLDRILDVFRKYEIPATLFVTGEVLEKYRDKLRQCSKYYEIASHSFTHRFWNSLNFEQRKKELEDFIDLYREIFNSQPLGFRAPSHVIDEEGIGLLENQGFLYDSSILPHYPPFKKYRGYRGRSPLLPYYIGKILEIPVRGQIFGIPVAGAWIRGFPFWVYRILFSVYSPHFLTLNMHSWDALDPQFIRKLEEILKILKKSGYQFLNGEQILKNRE